MTPRSVATAVAKALGVAVVFLSVVIVFSIALVSCAAEVVS
jgi:hypothetical protein